MTGYNRARKLRKQALTGKKERKKETSRRTNKQKHTIKTYQTNHIIGARRKVTGTIVTGVFVWEGVGGGG